MKSRQPEKTQTQWCWVHWKYWHTGTRTTQTDRDIKGVSVFVYQYVQTDMFINIYKQTNVFINIYKQTHKHVYNVYQYLQTDKQTCLSIFTNRQIEFLQTYKSRVY